MISCIVTVSQYDLELFSEVESLLGRKLDEKSGILETDVLTSLRAVSSAKKLAAIRLESYALRSKQSLKRLNDLNRRKTDDREQGAKKRKLSADV
jgi:hypothetical protein